jgi:hypothetical protein
VRFTLVYLSLVDYENTMKESYKESFQLILSLIYVAFVIAGISGISYSLFRPGGWVSNWLGSVWSMEMHYLVMAVPIFVISVIAIKKWLNGIFASSKGDTAVNLLMGILLLAGVYFSGSYFFY